MDPIIEYLTGLERGRASTVKHPEIKDVALDPDTLEFMEYLHGRQAFPFQTLDFKVGTQQGLHSDLIFFDSQPRGMMAAAWLALEDVTPNNGPLVFIPKSHQYGTWDFNDIGLHYEADLKIEAGQDGDVQVYYKKLPAAIENVGLKRAYADNVKRGQSFLWAAGLVHGGSEIKDKETTRMSQVTHYYFEGSQFYWEPRHSNPQENRYHFINKQILPCTHQPVKGMKEIYPCVQRTREQFRDHFLEEL